MTRPAQSTAPVDLHDGTPSIIATREYAVTVRDIGELSNLQGAMLRINSRRWRGYRRGTLKLIGCSVDFPPDDDGSGIITIAEYARPLRRFRVDRKYHAVYESLDFNGLPIGDEIKSH